MNLQGKYLCMVGLNCVDVIGFVKKYPLEDAEERSFKQTWSRGGNASNNSTVLSSLGVNVEYFGTLADDHLLGFFKEDLESCGIKFENCPILQSTTCPASVVICSAKTGSRTIIHNNGGFPELTFEQFQSSIILDNYSWIHFEGRNEIELEKILKYVQNYNESHGEKSEQILNYKANKLPISIEIEKYRSLSQLIPYGDVLFIGKDFAKFQGAQDFYQAAMMVAKIAKKGTLIVCSWGELGATYVISTGNEIDKSDITKIDAYPQPNIVDSLGAGDTFNSSVIYGLSKGWEIERTIIFACKVASTKLGIYGLKDLKNEIVKKVPEFTSD